VNVPWPCREYCGRCARCAAAIELELELYVIQRQLTKNDRLYTPAVGVDGCHGRPRDVLAYIARFERRLEDDRTAIRENVKVQGLLVDELIGRPPHRRHSAWSEFVTALRKAGNTYRWHFEVSGHDANDALGEALCQISRLLVSREVLGATAIDLSPQAFPPPQAALKERLNHAVELWPFARKILRNRFVDLTRPGPVWYEELSEELDSRDSPVEDVAEARLLRRRFVRTLPVLMCWVDRFPRRSRDFMRYMLARSPARQLAIAIDEQLGPGLGIKPLPPLLHDRAVAAALGITLSNLGSKKHNVNEWAREMTWELEKVIELLDADALTAPDLEHFGKLLTPTLAWAASLPEPEGDWVRHALAGLRAATARNESEGIGVDLPHDPCPSHVKAFRADIAGPRGGLRVACEDLKVTLAWVMSPL
jgi:hypothetical protein